MTSILVEEEEPEEPDGAAPVDVPVLPELDVSSLQATKQKAIARHKQTEMIKVIAFFMLFYLL